MAEALLSVPLEIAIEKLFGFIVEQIGLIASASDDARDIQYKFRSIRAVLADAERRQITDESVRLWLLKLKGIALDIEDVVEGWQISSAGDESMVRSTCLPSTPACFEGTVLSRCEVAVQVKEISKWLGTVVSRYKVAVQVKEIRKLLDEIYGESLMFRFSSSSGGGDRSETLGDSSAWRRTGSLMEESEIIGRDEDKETVVSWLVSDGQQKQQEEVHVTAIVGLAGLGKTTLARQILKDPKVEKRFEKAVYWVCVSDVFDAVKLTKDILLQATGAASSSMQPHVLQKDLLEALKGKRFLLVLDDVWNEDSEKWETLRLSLTSGEQGSRILVTTRKKKVAETMNASSRIHELQGLSNDLSWQLFCRIAFPGKEPGAELESIRKQIVNKCSGVPLLIKVMGTLMKENTEKADWDNILNSELWSLPEVRGKIKPVLQISYYNLLPHLKQCVAYCSIFEKDTVMKKHALVNLWAAQGFILPEGNRDIEDIGEGYFNSLVARSMFQEVREEKGITSCKIHDLLHDLATFLTEDESYTFTESKKSNPQWSSIGGVRHASLFLGEGNANILISSCPTKKLRTLSVNDLSELRGVGDKLFREARFLRALAFKDCREIKRLPKGIGKLKRLRYLDLSGTRIEKLPDALGKMKHVRYLDLSGTNIRKLSNAWGKMKHLRYLVLSKSEIKKLPDAVVKMENLRYLDLSGTEIEELPESVGDLDKLHTLNVSGCRRLKKLCEGICKIVGLRRLYFDELDFLPKGFGKLTSLQSLSKFIVGGENGEYCGINELQELNALQGCLVIKGLDRVSKAEQAASAQLCKKHGVRELVLDISSERALEDDKEGERIHVLERLRPHPYLQELSLKGKSVSKLTLPSWMEDPSFSNLVRINISGFKKQWESNNTMPGLGKLPGLKWLQISQGGVRKLSDEFYYGNEMISGSCYGVGKRRGGAFPKLESLTLEYMDELEEWELTGEADASKVMPSLRELKVRDCPKLQLLPSHLAIAPLSSSSSSEVLEAGENCEDHVLKPLERLEIFGCHKLQSLPHSLGQLKKLKLLEIWWATELTCLPDSLGQLESLEKLQISHCKKLESLPRSLGQLKKLKSLEIWGAEELTCLPDSLGQLESLEKLQIRICDQLESLPHSLGQLKKLKSLVIRYATQLTCLPRSLGQLDSLEILEIYQCGKLESLPDSLGQLKKLKSLEIQYARELTCLPDTLVQMESLEELEIEGCHQLESLPHSLGALKKLKSLSIKRGQKLEGLPQLLGLLESLEDLRIDDSNELESLPQSLGGLKKLTIEDAKNLESLPDTLGQLASLETLEICRCDKLKSLPDSLRRLQKLKKLYIERCEELESLPDSLQRLSLLQELHIHHCPGLPYQWERRREDWPEISHIPTILIDWQRLP